MSAVGMMHVSAEHSKLAGPLLRKAPGVVLGLSGMAVAGGSWRLGLTDEGSVGPGLWPFIAAVLLMVSAVGIVAGPVNERDAELDEAVRLGVVAAIVAMAAFAALLATVGIVTAIALISLLWLKVLAGEKWTLSVVTSFVLAGVVYGLFIHVLEIPLPVDAFLPR